MLDSPERRRRRWVRAWPVLQGVLPIERSRVPAEVVAGLTLAAVGIPAVLGYAKIAEMPAEERALGCRYGRLAGRNLRWFGRRRNG